MADAVYRVAELQERGWLLVEDGNHGEYRPRSNEFGSGECRFIRAADMDGGRVLFDRAEQINAAARARIRKGIGAPGDVLFSHKGTVGKVALVLADAPPFVCSPQTTFWRTLDERHINRRFLYYFLCSTEFKEQWEARKDETDMAAYVSLTAQRELVIRLPEIRTQQAIGSCLGTLDDKIELNRRMNGMLAELASTLFKSWFVDFDPVQAKRDGRKPVGVPETVVPYFPEHFEDSELGSIPKGWKARTLRDLFELNPRRELRDGTASPYLEMSNVPTLSHAPSEWAVRRAASGMRFMNGDTLLARITPCLENGKTAFVDFLDNGQVGWGSTEFIVIRAKPPLPLVTSYLLARHEPFRDHAIQSMTGSSGRQRVAMDALERFQLAVPDYGRLPIAFGGLVEPLFEQARAAAQESRTLSLLRDTLLPALISGEVSIKQAEKAVAEVA